MLIPRHLSIPKNGIYLTTNRIVRKPTNSVVRVPPGSERTWRIDGVSVLPSPGYVAPGHPDRDESKRPAGDLVIWHLASERNPGRPEYVIFRAPIDLLMHAHGAMLSLHRFVPLIGLRRLQQDLIDAARKSMDPGVLQYLSSAANQAAEAVESYRNAAAPSAGPISLQWGDGVRIERRTEGNGQELGDLMDEKEFCIFTVLEFTRVVST